MAIFDCHVAGLESSEDFGTTAAIVSTFVDQFAVAQTHQDTLAAFAPR